MRPSHLQRRKIGSRNSKRLRRRDTELSNRGKQEQSLGRSWFNVCPFVRFEMKHNKQLEEAKANSAAAIKELEHLQNEKRKMLMEHETAKLKELDESYSKEFTEWKNNLKPRKQVGRPFMMLNNKYLNYQFPSLLCNDTMSSFCGNILCHLKICLNYYLTIVLCSNLNLASPRN